MKSDNIRQVERLAFFSDAVFAIAITLLVLELKLPPLATADASGLWQAMAQIIPGFVSFLVSFLVIGAFWAAHHRVFRWVVSVDDTLIWRNLRLLLLIAFLPFPTAVMSEHPRLPAAAIFYTAVLAGAAINQIRLWQYALRTPGIASADVPAELVRRTLRRAWFLLIATGVAGVLCLYVPTLPVLAFVVLPISIKLASMPALQRLLQRLGAN